MFSAILAPKVGRRRSGPRRPKGRGATGLLVLTAMVAGSLWMSSGAASATAAVGQSLNLSAVSTADGVLLSWDPPMEGSESVSGYKVLRRRPRSGEARLSVLVADTGSADASYLDTTATTPGEVYVYRVRALAGDARGARSARARVQYEAPVVEQTVEAPVVEPPVVEAPVVEPPVVEQAAAAPVVARAAAAPVVEQAAGASETDGSSPAPLWSGSVTVGVYDASSPTGTGYSVWSDTGALSEEYFQLDDSWYRVLALVQADEGLYLGVTYMLPVEFTLHVGDEEFASGDSTEPVMASRGRYWWATDGPLWAGGDTVEVSISVASDEPVYSASIPEGCEIEQFNDGGLRALTQNGRWRPRCPSILEYKEHRYQPTGTRTTGYAHFYGFEVEATSDVRFWLSDFDTSHHFGTSHHYVIRAADGTELGHAFYHIEYWTGDRCAEFEQRCVADPQIDAVLEPGHYILELVQHYRHVSGSATEIRRRNFNVRATIEPVTLLEPSGADYPADATTPAKLGVSRSSPVGEIGSSSDVDWFAVNLEQGQRYWIYLEGDASTAAPLGDPRLVGVYDSASSLIADTTDDDSGVGNDSRVILAAAYDGVHYIAVGGQDGSEGTYRLSVEQMQPQIANTVSEPSGTDFYNWSDTTGRLAMDDPATGRVGTGGYSGPGDLFDAYKVNLERGFTYRFEMKGAPSGAGTLATPVLWELQDDEGTPLVAELQSRPSDWDGATEMIAVYDTDGTTLLGYVNRLDYTAPHTGTFYMLAGSYTSQEGTYTLTVTDITDVTD